MLGINIATVYAISNDKPRPLEEIYPEIGYKTVEEAIKEFEHHFKQDLKLPLRVPPVSFTHVFGRFNDVEGNDSFEMEYINEQSSENHFMINVRPVKDKFKIKDREVVKEYMLLNGKDATFISISGANLLVFERDNLQYRFSVDKRISDKITPEMLVGIANSIDYTTEIKD
ncbi:hypothetical protein KHA89_05530 [Bacillus sp. FJAT-49731]|nr:hypothetical protein [Lederbergia citrea]MBS4203554.1 hypothetical protein [Lederbergia citrea]